MRIARVLTASCSICFILVLCHPFALYAQIEAKQNVSDSIQCSIETETESWSTGKPTIVVVQLKNISDTDLDLVGIYSFQLKGIPGPYWSPVNILSGKPLELEYEGNGTGGRVPEGLIHLQAGETKAMRFDLSNLLWNQSVSSRWPFQKLFEVVPKGIYHLIFDIQTDRRVSSDNIPDVTHLASNGVRIVVE